MQLRAYNKPLIITKKYNLRVCSVALESIVFFVASLLMLVISSELLVVFATRIAKEFRAGHFFIGFMLVSLTTSFPELGIALVSSLEGNAAISAANLVGASIADVTWVLGITAIAGTVIIHQKRFLQSTRKVLLLSIIPAAVFFRGILDGMAAVVLGVVIALFFIEVTNTMKSKPKHHPIEPIAPTAGFLIGEKLRLEEKKPGDHRRWRIMFGFVLSAALLIASAFVVINATKTIALEFNIRETAIGITLLALATTLPETIVNLTAIRRKKVELALGDLFGSSIINLGMGGLIIAVLHPQNLNVMPLQSAVATLAAITIFYWIVSKKLKTVPKAAGVLLVVAYFIFLFYQITA